MRNSSFRNLGQRPMATRGHPKTSHLHGRIQHTLRKPGDSHKCTHSESQTPTPSYTFPTVSTQALTPASNLMVNTYTDYGYIHNTIYPKNLIWRERDFLMQREDQLLTLLRYRISLKPSPPHQVTILHYWVHKTHK